MTIRRFATNITDDRSFAEFNGNAVNGELVVNLDEDPPVLYISDNSGNLTAVATVTTVNANSVQVPQSPGTPNGQQGSQITFNNSGTLSSSWLMSLTEANSTIVSQAENFVFAHGSVNMNSAWLQTPDGGMLSQPWNIFQASLGTKIQGITFPPMPGDPPPATSLSGDYSIPVEINGITYYLHLSSTP
jgi:hypothetical protein